MVVDVSQIMRENRMIDNKHVLLIETVLRREEMNLSCGLEVNVEV